jgi:hypothetical protein
MVLIPWPDLFKRHSGCAVPACVCLYPRRAEAVLTSPVTVLGFLTGGIVCWTRSHSGSVFLACSPLVIFIYIGHLGRQAY